MLVLDLFHERVSENLKNLPLKHSDLSFLVVTIFPIISIDKSWKGHFMRFLVLV